MDIVYLRLTNGDEIFARLIGQEGSIIYLDDIMVMETIASDENAIKYLFMSRYIQYSDDNSMALDRTQIVFMKEAREEAKLHYLVSLQYAYEVSDAKFNEGMTDATMHLSKIIERHQNKMEEPKDLLESVKDRVLGTFVSDSKTKH